MSTTIDNLQIKIETSSQTGAAGIRDLASALGKLKKNGLLYIENTALDECRVILVIINIAASHFALPSAGEGDELILLQ